MIDKSHEDEYNEEVKVTYENGKTIYRLYRCGELVYIGVEDGKVGSRDRHLERHEDERLGEDGSD
jgi:hypothetical protein